MRGPEAEPRVVVPVAQQGDEGLVERIRGSQHGVQERAPDPAALPLGPHAHRTEPEYGHRPDPSPGQATCPSTVLSRPVVTNESSGSHASLRRSASTRPTSTGVRSGASGSAKADVWTIRMPSMSSGTSRRTSTRQPYDDGVTVTDARAARRPAGTGPWDRLPVPSEQALRRLAVASLVSQLGIVVTGGAVRLTGSGMGCPTVPRCTDDSLVATPELGVHGAIEFGNRLLTFVLAAVAALMLLAVLRTLGSERPRRDLVVPAVVLVVGIPAQALIGMVTVWTHLNPWIVMLHYMCSAALVAVATVLVRRAQRPLGAQPDEVGSPWLRRLAGATVAVAAVVVYLGTVVTGTGPHAGDDAARRTGLDLESVAQLHTDVVFLLIGLSAGLYFAARALGSPGRSARAAGTLIGVELGQGLVGVTQYALNLPVVLVGLHMLGAALLVAAVVDAWLAARWLPS